MEEYEKQLEQINEALSSCANDEDRKDLETLKENLKQLIELSFLESIENLEQEVDENQKEDLLNKKIRAPYEVNSHESYHNAFIASVIETIETEASSDPDYIISVFFLNPLFDKMKPCDHFLSGSCTFNENCKFSHGELILNSKVQDYIDPNFGSLKKNLHVLVKSSDDQLWRPATVLNIDNDLKTCDLKMQNGTLVIRPFEDILPPTKHDTDSESDLSSDESDIETQTSVRMFVAPDSFGEWERFTNGFGSKMLKKMGYEIGKGLGKNGEGRIEPVQARIYIPKKSLDFNMKFAEKNQRDTVEARCKRDCARENRRSQNASKSSTNDNMFSIINEVIKIDSQPKTTAIDLKTQSKKQLNLNNFKLSEDINKIEKSIVKLKETHKRQQKDPKALKNIDLQLDMKQKELNELKHKLHLLNREQDTRKSEKKLTIF